MKRVQPTATIVDMPWEQEAKEEEVSMKKDYHPAHDTVAKNYFMWEDIDCKVNSRNKGKEQEVALLRGVSGAITSSQMVAVVGPSGAGKTCFLDVLSGRKTTGTVSGQEDIFHPTQCVLEAVMFHTLMRLDPKLPLSDKKAMAQKLIQQAGLHGKENQYIGGMLPGGLRITGLSGGEKRRLSLCCGTINHPAILFADEPTSGLDSYAAMMSMALLREFSDRGMAVLCTIHQPRQAVWFMFDRVLVLAKGYQLFYGRPDDAETWFTTKTGTPCPLNTTPADFILDLVNIDFHTRDSYPVTTLDDLKQMADYGKADPLYSLTIRPTTDSIGRNDQSAVVITTQGGWWFKFGLLLRRNLKMYLRNSGNLLLRASLVVSMATIIGLVYRKCGALGAHQLIDATWFALLTAVLVPFASISTFQYDRQFFQRESAARIYPDSAYCASILLVELLINVTNDAIFGFIIYGSFDYQAFVHASHPIISMLGFVGSMAALTMLANIQAMFFSLACSNFEVAFIMAVSYTITSNLTAGVAVPLPDIEKSMRFLSYISMTRYPTQMLLLNFFKDNPQAVTPMGQPVEQYLHLVQLDQPATMWGNFLAVIAIFSIFTVGCFCCLRFLNKERR